MKKQRELVEGIENFSESKHKVLAQMDNIINLHNSATTLVESKSGTPDQVTSDNFLNSNKTSSHTELRKLKVKSNNKIIVGAEDTLEFVRASQSKKSLSGDNLEPLTRFD